MSYYIETPSKTIYFKSVQEAVLWARKNLRDFRPEMVRTKKPY